MNDEVRKETQDKINALRPGDEIVYHGSSLPRICKKLGIQSIEEE